MTYALVVIATLIGFIVGALTTVWMVMILGSRERRHAEAIFGKRR